MNLFRIHSQTNLVAGSCGGSCVYGGYPAGLCDIEVEQGVGTQHFVYFDLGVESGFREGFQSGLALVDIFGTDAQNHFLIDVSAFLQG